MQEILTDVTYPIVWLICSYVLKIESGLAKLLISLTAAILVRMVISDYIYWLAIIHLKSFPETIMTAISPGAHGERGKVSQLAVYTLYHKYEIL